MLGLIALAAVTLALDAPPSADGAGASTSTATATESAAAPQTTTNSPQPLPVGKSDKERIVAQMDADFIAAHPKATKAQIAEAHRQNSELYDASVALRGN